MTARPDGAHFHFSREARAVRTVTSHGPRPGKVTCPCSPAHRCTTRRAAAAGRLQPSQTASTDNTRAYDDDYHLPVTEKRRFSMRSFSRPL